ncbi:valine--tRNA ligase [Allorhizocola rhizosphaerae]|uniref:valine--tRNA ligase n=1 Tax=Allorhizocola rhizosphaerae TaxID=1872709 RepID=UPI000E3BB76F|nr:valine--tRNA ligase [Allorhizocola rhizosphaerae]
MNLDELAGKWSARWETDQIYRFDPGAPRERVFAIDTPPPTVSGQLHMGTVFGYVQTDVIARYSRMQGKTVFYPMGWDDNGLPTERRVQNHFGVRCDPSVPYDPHFTPPMKGETPISRRNFIELCHELTTVDERSFEEVFRAVGLSVDWSMLYTTIGRRAQAVSQRAFLDALAAGDAYRAHGPTLWDTTFQTAVAQAELEERQVKGAFHDLRFGPVTVKTTRPELLPACVALVANPSDNRYRDLFGTRVSSPLGDEVPVLAHHLADPQKGTGIAMVCTFGDTTDVIWQRELDLPIKPVLGLDGRFLPDVPHVGGLTVPAARARIVELLGLTPSPITHAVKFYEKGSRPLEIIPTGQWYLRNGGRDQNLREELLERGRSLRWHPAHMRVRYEHWVNGLAGDWLVSRQRYFGVPLPLWYRLDGSGNPQYDEPLVPQELPVDPAIDTPPGYDESQRGKPDGFIGDPDVLDTWATSTLTPSIAGFDGTMDLRPQGPEIIRTWLFGTVLRYHTLHGRLPWTHTMINGWILDPDRKKMSKSVGNVVTPMELLREHSPDAVRYWAAAASLGTDTAFDVGQMKVGRRLATKILNASRFMLGLPSSSEVDRPLDQSMLAGLALTTAAAKHALDEYDYSRALDVTERFFWRFCDDYLELIKARAYEGAPPALRTALSTLLRLFAPMLPYCTEEAWSWWQEGSIHRSPWPSLPALGDPSLLDLAGEAIRAVRKAKSDAKLSMKAPVSRLIVHCEQSTWELLGPARDDVRAAGTIGEIEHRLIEGPPRFEAVITPGA